MIQRSKNILFQKIHKSINFFSIILFVVDDGFLFLFLLNIFPYWQSKPSIFFLLFHCNLLILYLLLLHFSQPVIIVPNRDMIIRLEIERFRLSNFNDSFQELSLVVVVYGGEGVFDFVKLNEGESSVFLCDLIQRYLNGFNLSEGAEECE